MTNIRTLYLALEGVKENNPAMISFMKKELCIPGNTAIFDHIKMEFDELKYSNLQWPNRLKSIDHQRWLYYYFKALPFIENNKDVAKSNEMNIACLISQERMDTFNKSCDEDIKACQYKDIIYFLFEKSRRLSAWGIEIPIVTYTKNNSEGVIRNIVLDVLKDGSGELFSGHQLAFIELDDAWQRSFVLVFSEITNNNKVLQDYDFRWYVTTRLSKNGSSTNSLPPKFEGASASAAFAFSLETLTQKISSST